MPRHSRVKCNVPARHHLVCAIRDRLQNWQTLHPKFGAEQVGGTTKDHATYLLPRGTADVFFPTDFRMLARLYEAAARAAPTQLTGALYVAGMCIRLAGYAHSSG